VPLDPSIILYAVGASIQEDELVQMAGCCITLVFKDEYGRKRNRIITHPIGNAPLNRAHLQAAHLALASVVRSMRRVALVTLICPACVKAALDDTDPEYCEIGDAVVGELRKWASFYSRLRFVSSAGEDIPGFDRARECAESQSGSDTGTIDG